MASGHVNRANRPNTWLDRPACKRAESPCQQGAVHTWHISDEATWLAWVRFRLLTGHPSAGPPCRRLTRSGRRNLGRDGLIRISATEWQLVVRGLPPAASS